MSTEYDKNSNNSHSYNRFPSGSVSYTLFIFVVTLKVIIVSILLNCYAFLLIWVASVSVYLSSVRQSVLSAPISKKISFPVFIVCTVIAMSLLMNIHHWLAALLILSVAIMTVWISLALVIPYFPRQRKTLVVGTVLTLLTALLGAFYVA